MSWANFIRISMRIAIHSIFIFIFSSFISSVVNRWSYYIADIFHFFPGIFIILSWFFIALLTESIFSYVHKSINQENTGSKLYQILSGNRVIVILLLIGIIMSGIVINDMLVFIGSLCFEFGVILLIWKGARNRSNTRSIYSKLWCCYASLVSCLIVAVVAYIIPLNTWLSILGFIFLFLFLVLFCYGVYKEF